MTSNQLQYWKQKEDKRHNEVVENETERHNRVMEEVGALSAQASMLGAKTNALFAPDYANAALWGAAASMTSANASWLSASSNAEWAGYNATTNRMNAETKQGELELGWAKHQDEHDKWVTQTGTNIVTDMFKIGVPLLTAQGFAK